MRPRSCVGPRTLHNALKLAAVVGATVPYREISTRFGASAAGPAEPNRTSSQHTSVSGGSATARSMGPTSARVTAEAAAGTETGVSVTAMAGRGTAANASHAHSMAAVAAGPGACLLLLVDAARSAVGGARRWLVLVRAR